MKAIRHILDTGLQFFCCSLFLLMIIVSTWQVASRYIFNDPSTVTEAILRCLLIWLSSVSIAYVVGQREHVSLTLLTDKLNEKWQLILAVGVEVIFIAFSFFVLIYGGGKATSNSMSQLYPILQIPKSIIYVPLVLAGVIIVIYSCLNCHSLYRPTAKMEN
ncbi:TRAP transporter small permease [Phytohalomonas tamaricis]|uniref:TRAP transporter small permease n=1 Tax=Phytohalomonas tamaricis TaxID=2081032 RepID=UPI000D0B5698|nr:TRAP transporter small permease [Phytohalomonas tamaricis]